jgi:hypothetical protein
MVEQGLPLEQAFHSAALRPKLHHRLHHRLTSMLAVGRTECWRWERGFLVLHPGRA